MKYTVIYGVYIQSWPTLHEYNVQEYNRQALGPPAPAPTPTYLHGHIMACGEAVHVVRDEQVRLAGDCGTLLLQHFPSICNEQALASGAEQVGQVLED
jgi:hypothetical protein